MFPKTFGIQTYILLYVGAMVLHVGVLLYYCRRLAIAKRVGVLLGVTYIWAMCVGARILYDLKEQQFDYRNYLSLEYYMGEGLWGGPLAYLAVAVVGVLVLSTRKLDTLDLIALGLPLPMLAAKLACFMNGCCYGAACALPWAVTFPEGGPDYGAPPGIARHPTQLYEVGTMAIVWLVLARLDRSRWRGRLLVWFTMLYGLGRPLSEVFRAVEEREDAIGPLTKSQLVCLLAGATCAAILVRFRPATRDDEAASSNEAG